MSHEEARVKRHFLTCSMQRPDILEKIKLQDNEVVKQNADVICLRLPVSRAEDRTGLRRVGVAEEDILEDQVCMAVHLQVLRFVQLLVYHFILIHHGHTLLWLVGWHGLLLRWRSSIRSRLRIWWALLGVLAWRTVGHALLGTIESRIHV